MFKILDNYLNGITMYRLVLYCLIFLLISSGVLSFFRFLPFNPFDIIFSASFLIFVCWITNSFLAKILKVPTNVESFFITALILALIITPAGISSNLILLVLVGVLSQASKYILALNGKHFFNPAAFGVVSVALVFSDFGGASWWVGTTAMMPFVLIIGLLIVRKIQRFNLVISFLFTAMLLIFFTTILKGNNAFELSGKVIIETPLLFFAVIMLTEPLTTPPTKKLQILYGTLVALLFSPLLNVGSFYFTPEAALFAGNIFSYIVSPKRKLLLSLKEKVQIAPDIYDFIFTQSKKRIGFNIKQNEFTYKVGQYMEWTLPHEKPDSRGNRRFFTIASSPTEDNIRIGVKFNPKGSSFKKALLTRKKGAKILAGQLMGDFILPDDVNEKLCFIAGGIGITPFRSMIKYLLGTNQKRDIILLYSNKLQSDIVYKKIFDEAFKKLEIKTVYNLTETELVAKDWKGRVGYIDVKIITEEVPDYKDRIFYISGPHNMVEVFKRALKEIGVASKQIKVDFFPGYA